MKDTVIVAPGKSAAEQAVSYMLRRIQQDANLRWYMAHTEAYRLLCEAEAIRTGESADAIADRYAPLFSESDQPAAVRARKAFDRLEDLCRERDAVPATRLREIVAAAR